MIEVVAPAPFLAARTLFDTARGLKPDKRVALAPYQLALAQTHGLCAGGDLLVVVGFWPFAPRVEEVFLLFADRAAVAPHAVALARAGRLIVRERLQDGSVDRLVAWVKRDHEPGNRLARAMGFGLAPRLSPLGVFFPWEIAR